METICMSSENSKTNESHRSELYEKLKNLI